MEYTEKRLCGLCGVLEADTERPGTWHGMIVEDIGYLACTEDHWFELIRRIPLLQEPARLLPKGVG